MKCIEEEDAFLKHSLLSKEEFDKAEIDWPDLLKIGLDHDRNNANLSQIAQMIANVMQSSKAVHSVRWRIKDPNHLMAKIIRKRINGSDKYSDISVKNYQEKITDLVGVRVLHLFKNDWLFVHKYIESRWSFAENVIAYHREGDHTDEYRQLNFDIQEHKAGYRSIHYILETSPMKSPTFVEVQVRTLFEEAWSEIDHKVRYPNFSDNEMLSYFLKIFNGMAGSADEMGSFVHKLTEQVRVYENEIQLTKRDASESRANMEQLLTELASQKNTSRSAKKTIEKLRSELEVLEERDRQSNPHLYMHELSPASVMASVYANTMQDSIIGALDYDSLLSQQVALMNPLATLNKK